MRSKPPTSTSPTKEAWVSDRPDDVDAAFAEIVADLDRAAPRAMIVNYTNPVNLVAQAVTTHSDIPFVALCEGPLYSPAELASAIGLDPALLDVRSIGLNHASWSVHHTKHELGNVK